jgi:hypothetical protein
MNLNPDEQNEKHRAVLLALSVVGPLRYPHLLADRSNCFSCDRSTSALRIQLMMRSGLKPLVGIPASSWLAELHHTTITMSREQIRSYKKRQILCK